MFRFVPIDTIVMVCDSWVGMIYSFIRKNLAALIGCSSKVIRLIFETFPRSFLKVEGL